MLRFLEVPARHDNQRAFVLICAGQQAANQRLTGPDAGAKENPAALKALPQRHGLDQTELPAPRRIKRGRKLLYGPIVALHPVPAPKFTYTRQDTPPPFSGSHPSLEPNPTYCYI